MEAHQKRVVDEKVELDDKVTKLNTFFSNPIFAGLDSAEQERLRRQYAAMLEYSVVLGERIAVFIQQESAQ